MQMQLFVKQITNNSLIERDRLYEYSVGAFYAELNLFFRQAQQSKPQSLPFD
jgi:hypothetical protein